MTDIGSQLIDAATMMLTGMVVVFTFLTILVFLVRLMSKLAPKEEPQPSAATQPVTNTVSSPSSAVSPQVVAAISAAVHQHRTSVAK